MATVLRSALDDLQINFLLEHAYSFTSRGNRRVISERCVLFLLAFELEEPALVDHDEIGADSSVRASVGAVKRGQR